MPARKGLLAPQNTFLQTIAQRFDGTHSNFVLGNAKFFHHSYPIVYCSDGFCELTGYSRAQVMQKSCACDFLYGQKTDVQHTSAIKGALQDKQELKLEVILYKKSGTPFWCLLDIVPIQNENHEVVLFLCSHKDITKQKLHEQAKRLQQQQQLHLANQNGQHQDGDDPSQNAAGKTASSASDQTQAAQTTTTTSSSTCKQQASDQHQQDQPAECKADGQLQLFQQQANQLEQQHQQFDSDDREFEPASSSGSDSDELAEQDRDKHTISQYSRRRSRAVLYQLSGHYGQQRGVNMKSKLNLNTPMNLPEYKTTTIERRRFILSHYGLYKTCWDWLILIVSFYVAIVVPYNATFRFKKQESDEAACQIDAIDIIVEVVFVIDVVLNFRTTFVNRKGEVVTMPKTICKHYIQGWFFVDLCAALPFDLLCPLNPFGGSRLDLNLLKLIRLLRLARLLQKMDRYSQYSYIILTLLMLIFSLLAHWAACVWYAIAMKEIERNKELKIGWLHQLSDKLGYNVLNGNTTDIASAYVTALYFTTSSLTSVGFGNVSANTNAEKIFSIVIMLIGALMHALVFGNVTALIRVMYARRSNYQTRLRDLKDFFRLHQLPKHLTQRMNDYFQTTWSLNHGIDTSEILRDFPEELRGDVSMYLHREVLSLPIFQSAPTGFLKSLAKHIESKFCCPTEYLIHRGDALNYLYLVCNGSMEILQENMVVAILSKDDLVGYDVCALQDGAESKLAGLPVKSSSDLKALTYCDLKCIHIHGLLEVLKLYPEFSDIFHNEIVHDLSFNLRDSHEGNDSDDDDDNNSDNKLANQPAEGEPAALQRVCRSITATEHEIGRYDDREDTADDEADRTQDEDDQDEEDDDEDEEEDEDEDEDDEPNSDDRHSPGAGGELVEGGRSGWQPDETDGKTDGKPGSCNESSLGERGRRSRRRGQREADSLSFDGGAPVGLRPAIGRPGGLAKGPISFDLSRNTTAIVDRRRRSAGCIGPTATGGLRRRRARHTSSLIHISEEGGGSAGRRTRSPGEPELAGQLAALNRALAGLRQEVRRELREFRVSVQLLLADGQPGPPIGRSPSSASLPAAAPARWAAPRPPPAALRSANKEPAGANQRLSIRGRPGLAWSASFQEAPTWRANGRPATMLVSADQKEPSDPKQYTIDIQPAPKSRSSVV